MTGRGLQAGKRSHAQPSRVTAPTEQSHEAAGCDVTDLVVERAVSRHQKAEAEGSGPRRQWPSTCVTSRSGNKERSATRLPRVPIANAMDGDVLRGSHAVDTLSARPARPWNTQTRRGTAAQMPLCTHAPSGVKRRARPARAMVSRTRG